MGSPYQPQALFRPAATSAEAVARIFALTGRQPDGSRGEKRALVALRDALGLQVDTVRTNAVLGRALAHALKVEWDPVRYTERNTVNLAGLNVLLAAATRARQADSLQRL